MLYWVRTSTSRHLPNPKYDYMVYENPVSDDMLSVMHMTMWAERWTPDKEFIQREIAQVEREIANKNKYLKLLEDSLND